MPEMDGFEATASSVRKWPSRHHRGAHGERFFAEDRQKCLDAGMDDYLAKPISVQGLAAILGKWLPATGTGSLETALTTSDATGPRPSSENS